MLTTVTTPRSGLLHARHERVRGGAVAVAPSSRSGSCQLCRRRAMTGVRL